MALSRRAGGRSEVNTWPGFVDAMTALLMILMFVMSIFMIVQFTMQQKLSGQSKQLDDLNRQLAGLADVLALERDRSAALEGQVGELTASLGQQRSEADRLTAALAAMTRRAETGEAEVDRLSAAMAALTQSRDEATSRVAELEATLAQTRTEMDAAVEQARLAAARREALEAMVADLEARDAERVNALNLLAELQQDKESLEQEKESLAAQVVGLMDKGEAADAALARLAEIEAKLSDEEKARLAEAAAVEELRQRLEGVEAELTEEEKARLAEAAAAEALRKKLAESGAELDAMTLALEKARKEAEDTLVLLAAANQAREALQSQLEDGGAAIDREATLRQLAEAELAKAQAQTVEEQKQVALLNAQVRELREQLGGLEALLTDYEKRDSEAQVQIARLGERLNAALAQKVGELAGLRSVFFEKREKVLGGRQDIQRVGDRFVFQSEVLFAAGSAELGGDGREQLGKLGEVLREVVGEMPEDLNWILRVDGHTDKIPVSRGGRYRDNWELSQARALSVVKYLIEREGVAPERLAATGFGEFQPVDAGDTPEALAKNRRIEFKFTER